MKTQKIAPIAINTRMNLLSCIGILLVVCGHLNTKVLALGDFFPYYSYHLEIFLFISGYFYSTAAEEKPLTYITRKARSTIGYLAVWVLIYAIIAELIALWLGSEFTIMPRLTLNALLINPYISSASNIGFIGPAWYMVALFLVLLVNLSIRLFFGKICKRTINEKAVCIISVIMGIAGIYIMNAGTYSWPFKRVFQIAFMFPFFSIGRLYRVHLEKLDTLPNTWYFAIVFSVQTVLLVLYGTSPASHLAHMVKFNNPVLDFLCALTGVAFALRLSRILDTAIGCSKVVLYIGQNTRTIMSHHMFWYFVLHMVLSFIAPYINNMGIIDYAKLYTTVYYHYYPFGIGSLGIVYVILTIALPLVTLKLMQKCKAALFQR